MVAVVADNLTERTMIEVRGPRIQVERFIVICKTIAKMCHEGSSRTMSFDVDGDGAGNLSFTIDPRFKNLEAGNTDCDPVRVPGINDY